MSYVVASIRNDRLNSNVWSNAAGEPITGLATFTAPRTYYDRGPTSCPSP